MSNVNIQKILIPVDFAPASENAIEYGAYLARNFQADIILLHILDGVHTYPADWFNAKNKVTDTRWIRKKVADKFSEYAKTITKKYGIRLKTILTTGSPAGKIAETVEKHEMDLIVMGTHGANGFEEFFVGNTAHKVVNLSPCPIITVREGFKSTGIKSIVLPIDESLHSRQKVNNIIPIATKCKSVVHILGLVQNEDDEQEMAKFDIKINTVEKAVKKAGLTCTKKIAKGDNIAMEAMNYADEVHAELLAIMTDHESDMPGTFMGAFAHQIVNHSQVPVLSIKPVSGAFSYPT